MPLKITPAVERFRELSQLLNDRHTEGSSAMLNVDGCPEIQQTGRPMMPFRILDGSAGNEPPYINGSFPITGLASNPDVVTSGLTDTYAIYNVEGVGYASRVSVQTLNDIAGVVFGEPGQYFDVHIQ